MKREIFAVLCAVFQYHLSPLMRGIVFLVAPAIYALATPLWGWIVDNKVNNFASYFYFDVSFPIDYFMCLRNITNTAIFYVIDCVSSGVRVCIVI